MHWVLPYLPFLVKNAVLYLLPIIEQMLPGISLVNGGPQAINDGRLFHGLKYKLTEFWKRIPAQQFEK